MMRAMVDVFNHISCNTKIVFLGTIILALLLPQLANAMQPLLIPIIIIMLTFSVKNVTFQHLHHGEIKTMVKLVVANYLILTPLYIVMARLFVSDPLYQQAIIILGIMPPAIGILSLTYLLHGNMHISFIAEFIAYLASIVLVPLFGYLALGNSISPARMISIILLVMVLPFALSRILRRIEGRLPGSSHLHDEFSHGIVNVCYAASFYIIIGINRDVFLSSLSSLWDIFFVLILLKFVFGTTIFLLLKKTHMAKSIDVLYTLFATFKNGGAGAAVTILLLGVGATVPFAINGILVALYIVYLEWFILHKTA